MDPALLSQLKEELLLCEALSSAECEVHLRDLASRSPELERELRSLLDQIPIAEPGIVGVPGFFPDGAPDPESPPRGPALRQLGPYHLLEVIGVGGMGIVYRAEQREPLQREVAVKLLRGGLDADRVLARFAAERRAMALLDHPAIARILDAGLDTDGMPYLVTELVRGTPISDYCRERRLPTAEVLRLFIEVCRAVQHAHQKGIIHRDLKPSNLMVVEVDGVPRPKIIDFGIARILEEEEVGGRPTLTVEGQAIGTLGYMSPEQAMGRSRAIDTRTDVYSLGAVLYELLAGSLPHALEGKSFHEALEIVARDPPRPFRITVGDRLTRDDELETVVLKALAHEPGDRYEGAGALADDLERYLANEVVLARPPSATYEMRKLVRRHRMTFLIGAAVLVLVAGFALAMAVLYAGQRRERQRAEIEGQRTAAMNRFLLDMLSAASPKELGRGVTVREVLDRAVSRVDAGFTRTPQVQAGMVTTLGTTYRELGQYAIADSLLRRGLELTRRTRGERHVDVAWGLRELAANSFNWRHTEEADSICRVALAMSEEIAGPRSPETESCLLLLADIQNKLGLEARAESLLTRYLDLARALHGENSVEFARGLVTLGMARMISGHADASIFLNAERIFSGRLGPDDPETLDALSNYADALGGEGGRSADVVAVARDMLDRTRRKHGEEHPRVAEALYRLGSAQIGLDSCEAAERNLLEGLRIWRKTLGDENPLLVAGYASMVGARMQQGDLAGGELWARRALELSLKVHSEEHPRSVGQMQVLAGILHRRGRDAEAEPIFRRVVAIRRRVYGVTSPVSAQAFAEYGVYLFDRGRVDSARTFLSSALPNLLPIDGRVALARACLAMCGESAEAGAPADSTVTRVAREILAASWPAETRQDVRSRVVRWFDGRHRPDLAAEFRAPARPAGRTSGTD